MTKPHWSYPLYRLGWSGIDWLFPPRCGGCDKIGSRWCSECQESVVVIGAMLCQKCGRPQSKNLSLCDVCRSEPPLYNALRSWAAFDSGVRQALLRLKYRRDMALGDALAVPFSKFSNSLNWPVDFIVPVPVGKKRLRERGYNQVALIARPLALSLNLEYKPAALKRNRETRSQVGLSAVQRRENVKNAFVADADLVRGKVILIVDDVTTTGATLSSSAEALCQAGVKDVFALTVARALPHHGLNII